MSTEKSYTLTVQRPKSDVTAFFPDFMERNAKYYTSFKKDSRSRVEIVVENFGAVITMEYSYKSTGINTTLISAKVTFDASGNINGSTDAFDIESAGAHEAMVKMEMDESFAKYEAASIQELVQYIDSRKLERKGNELA